MSDFKFDKKYLLEQTNGGLDVITRLFPEAENNGRYEHFKLRDEKTASVCINKKSIGTETVTVHDFGSGESYNCFDLVMEQEGLSFGEACKWIAAEMGLGGLNVQFSRAELRFENATKDQQPGQYFFDYKEELNEFELDVLGPLVSNDDCEIFNLKSCNSFTQIKKYPADHAKHPGKTMQIITTATEKYPIFVFDYGEWQKIYQPLNTDKKFRFRYAGTKPENHVFGLETLEDAFEIRKEGAYQNDKKDWVIADESDFGDVVEKSIKFKWVVIAGGDRDGLNVSSFGYKTVWLNSETAKLDYDVYKRLKEIAENVCYVGDLDDTGIKETVKLAMDYIDIKIIWLPEWIKTKTYRGKPRKDVTDFAKLLGKDRAKRKFEALVNTSLPARFWTEKKDEKGRFKGYDFDNEACYRFLTYNGFFRYQEDYSKQDFSFIRVENGIVERVKFHEVANFPGDWIRRKNKPISLLNYVHRTAQLTEKKLASIQRAEPDFKKSGIDFQRLFFKNEIWTVNKEGISKETYKNNKYHVWKDNIIDHNVTIAKTPNFTISKTEAGAWDIAIHNTENDFLNYLINTSRVHWRKCGNVPFEQEIKKLARLELTPQEKEKRTAEILARRKKYRDENRFNIKEDGLTPEEIAEQKLCLVNKIFAFGYLLHSEKVADKAWSVFAMDNKISDVGDSNGGSGKSVLFSVAITELIKSYKNINGGDPDLIKSQFLMDGVTRETDIVVFDDVDSHFPMRKVFNNVTGEFSVNPKFGKPYNLKYIESPKTVFTSNFGLFKADGSTLRRLLFVPFSDYYHYKTDENFEEHKISDDYGGKTLFRSWDRAEYNNFFNAAAESLQFFLSCTEKIDPPMDNVKKRNSLQTMGDAFKDWADAYLGNSLDQNLSKLEAFTDFKASSGTKWTANRFKKSIQEWCKYYGYIFNPDDLAGKDGRIMEREMNGSTTEKIHIRKPWKEEETETEASSEADGDIPF